MFDHHVLNSAPVLAAGSQHGVGRVTDYGRPVKKSPSLHSRKSNPNPKFYGTAEAYFVCHISPKYQISLIHVFIWCP